MPRRNARRSVPPATPVLTELDLLQLVFGEFVYRRCVVCEWEGQLVQSPKSELDCPVCHAPTELVAFLHPMTETVTLWKNP